MLFVVDTNYIYISSPHFNCTFIMYIYMDFSVHITACISNVHWKCCLLLILIIHTFRLYISIVHS